MTRRYFASSAVIFNSKGEVLLGQRHEPGRPGHNKWNLPGGGIDYGEQAKDAALRETFEEVGIQIEIIDDRALVNTLQIPDKNAEVIMLTYPAIYKSGNIDFSQDPGTVNARWFTIDEIKEDDCLSFTKERIQTMKCLYPLQLK